MKDATDVVELLKAGIDRAACRAWLDANAPALRARFDALVARAGSEFEAEQDVDGAVAAAHGEAGDGSTRVGGRW